MTREVKFIISTQDDTSRTRKAHKRAVRSHVTSQRYKKRRQDAVRENEQAKRESLDAIPSSSVQGAVSRASPDIELVQDLPQDHAYGPEYFKSVILPISDDHVEEVPRSQAPVHDNDELRLERDGGKLLPLTLPPSPFTYVGNGLSDPFESLPHFIVPQMGKHLFYYVNVLMPGMHPSYTTNLVRRTYGCRSWVGADEVFMNVIAAYSATSRAMSSGDLVRTGIGNKGGSGFHESTVEWLYFKNRAIKLINHNLTKWRLTVVEETIRGITGLILIEAFTGNLGEATTHMRGLQRLVALQYRDSPMPYRTAEQITRAAVKLANLSRSKPIVPFTITFDFPLPLPSISHMLPTLGTQLISKWPDISSNQDLLPILYDLAIMTRYTEAVYDWIYPYSEDDSYFEFIEFRNLFIEHSLLSYEGANEVDECVRLACVLYLSTALSRAYPNESAIIHNNVDALKGCLEVGELDSEERVSTWTGHEDVLFWVLFIGTHCSYGQAEEQFFVEALKGAASISSLASFEDANALLSSFFFVDRVHLHTLRLISSQIF